MKVVEPGHHVELRRSVAGMDSVVFAFPYRADVVEAVRGIPGRRFDWETKEWWAPRADATAPYVQRVIERHDWLSVAPEVEEWLSRAVSGWVGRVTTGRREGEGVFLLETVAGELEGLLAEQAEPDGPWLRIPFSQEAAEALLDAKGARLDPRAQRCASRLQVGQK